jgi:hypothetical protein
MIDTLLLKIMVLTLKIIFYTSNADIASVDMLQYGKYLGTVSYKVEKKKMNVSFETGKEKVELMKISTIDNGLYSVELKNEKTFKFDLADYYLKLNWKKLYNINKKIQIEKKEWLKFTTSENNLYINYEKFTFVVKKDYLNKNKRAK